MRLRYYLPMGAAALLLFVATMCHAQVPQKMNYQVMLTDDANQPLADQSVQLVFRIYDVESGGGSLWTETHSPTTNSIGVVSVVLGNLNPLTLDFDVPLWLQVEVDGEPMTPRRALAAAPYALRAQGADHATGADSATEADHAAEADHATSADDAGHASAADQATDSDELGGVPAASYALDDDLWQPGTLNNPANPLEWTKLKSVPAGFADGVDDAGMGDGNSLDALDGVPMDVVEVDADGKTHIGYGGPYIDHNSALSVGAGQPMSGVQVEVDSPYSNRPALFALATGTSAILCAAKMSLGSAFYPWDSAAVVGYGEGDANGGQFTSGGSGIGLVCGSSEGGHALHSKAYGTGYSGYFEGGSGVYLERPSGYPALEVKSTLTTGYADALYVETLAGVNAATWALRSQCVNGVAGVFVKSVDDDAYSVRVNGANASSEGLYVLGTITSTALTSRTVDTSRGKEAVFGVSAAEAEVIASGEGRLSAGSARVEFDWLFAESISGPEALRVTATPIGRWSALYIEAVDETGFNLRSEAGDGDVAFHWVVVGRAAGHERRPEVTIPPDNDVQDLAGQKSEELRMRRPEKREHSGVVVVDRDAGPIEAR